ncbi:hypothetical protein BH09BAC6_BH09BAC6_11500 [soil metagenome]|jgi:hypothetical protein
MKKKINFLTTILLPAIVLSLSSCLKDNRFVDFSKGGTIVEFSKGGKSGFGADAITEATDTVTRQISINVASVTPPTSATKITLSANDQAITTAYNTSDPSVSYLPFPAGSYAVSTTSVTIPAGQRIAIITVTIYKSKLNPALSYMLPVAITNAGGLTISGSKGIHYFHAIGNDFAGPYEHFYTRWNTPDTVSSSPSTPRSDKGVDIFNPVSPNEFTVVTDYFTQPRYDVTFTKTGSGAGALYSNFAIKFFGTDEADLLNANGVTVGTSPQFLPADYKTNPFDPNKAYTYAQALKLFRFYFTTGSRSIIDQFIK